MKKGYLKKETESAIVAAQGQALCIRNLRNKVESIKKMLNLSVVYVVLLMKQLLILFQNAQN